MTWQESKNGQRMSISELNQLLDNASASFRQHNIHPGYIFELKKRFQNSGIEGLKDLPAVPRVNPRKTSSEIVSAILALSLEHPGWGCVRLGKSLKTQGIIISSPTIQKILIKHDLGNRNERLAQLEEKVLAEQIQLSDEQLALIEKTNPCFRERFNASCRPGEILAQDTLLVGVLKGVGKVYLQSVVDCYNSYTFGFLHPGKLPDWAVTILHNDVLPFYRQYNLRIQTIITSNSREYCGTAKHHYELYLLLNEIDHQKTRLRARHTNGFSERFNRTVLDEFFLKATQYKSYDSIEKLQADFEQWLHFYNNERPHLGYPNMGNTPVAVYNGYFEEISTR